MQLARMLRQRISPTAEFQSYLQQTEALYQSIAEVSGKSIIVDSSKHPIRGVTHAPARHRPAVGASGARRRAVVWSRKKSLEADQKSGVQFAIKPRSAWYSVAFWAFINVLATIVCLFRRRQSLRMRYEDFVAEPQVQLERLGHVCGLDYSATAAAADRSAFESRASHRREPDADEGKCHAQARLGMA